MAEWTGGTVSLIVSTCRGRHDPVGVRISRVCGLGLPHCFSGGARPALLVTGGPPFNICPWGSAHELRASEVKRTVQRSTDG